MLGLDLQFDVDLGLSVSGIAVYGIELLACVALLYHRRHPYVHRLSPRMLAISQLAAFAWFLTLAFNDSLADLWDAWSWTCWIPQLSVRAFCFTAFIASVVSRHYVVYSRWLSVERFTTSLTLINGAFLLANISLVVCLVLVGNGHASAEEKCALCEHSAVIYLVYQGVLLLAVCVMTVILARTVYIDTRADYRVLHPKALNAMIDMAAMVMMAIVYGVIFHTNYSQPTSARDNVLAGITALGIPSLMFWSQIVPALLGVGQQSPEMSVIPSQVFDHSTGAFTSNVADLPKLRRVLADDSQRLKPSRGINDATSIPMHDTQSLFDLIANGDVDSCRNFLLERGVDLLGVPGPSGQTALHVAVGCSGLSQETRLQVVELLMDMKASLGMQDSEGRTPLHLAASLSDPQLVCFMVQSAMKSAKFGDSANPHMTSLINVIACDGATPLHIATKLQDMGTLTMLLGMGADPSRCAPCKLQTKAEDWDTAYEASIGDTLPGKASFMLAVEMGALPIVQQMVSSSPRTCDLEQLSPHGLTPLMAAAYLRHTQVALFLLKSGANVWHTMPSARPSRGLSVLHCCAIGGDPIVLNAVAKELTSCSQMPIGTDTDTYERCTSISESDSMNAPIPAAPQDIPASLRDHLPESASQSCPSTHLLERSMQISHQYSADQLPRIAFTSSRNLGSINSDAASVHEDGFPTDDDVRAAMTVLAARGELEPLPAEQALLNKLEDIWDASTRGAPPADSLTTDVQRAIQDLLPGSDQLRAVLAQEQFQWTGAAFASPLTAPKARQLAAEVRRKVANPAIDISNFAAHERRLAAQAAALPDDEQDKILRSLDVLGRHVEHLTGERVRSLQYRSPSMRSVAGSPRAQVSRSPTEGLYEQLKKDIDFLTDTDSIPMNVHRYLNRCDCWGRTALHWAVLRRNSGAVYFLLMLGSSVSIRDRKSRRRSDVLGLTSMQYAERLYTGGCVGPYLAVAEAERQKTKLRQRTSTSLRIDDFPKPPTR